MPGSWDLEVVLNAMCQRYEGAPMTWCGLGSGFDTAITRLAGQGLARRVVDGASAFAEATHEGREYALRIGWSAH